MSETQMVVLSLSSEDAARDLVRQLDAIGKLDQNVTIVDAAIAEKTQRGKPKLKQLRVSGSRRGGVVGAIGGALSGLASLFGDAGIDDDMMRRTAEELSPGEVALFILYEGDWRRSSAVLRDALAAHGISYGESDSHGFGYVPSRPSTEPHGGGFPPLQNQRRPVPPPQEPTPEEAFVEEPHFEEEPPVVAEEFEVAPPAETAPEPAQEAEDAAPEVALEAEDLADVGEGYVVAEPVVNLEEAEPEPIDADDVAQVQDAVARASLAAITAAAEEAADVTAAEDAAVYADEVDALAEASALAGETDILQGEEMQDRAAQVGDAGAHVGLLALERKTSGLEVGRIAGELAQISREVGQHEMPILAALLESRSGILQRIAAAMVASAADARELAHALDSAGMQLGNLAADEVDEGTARLIAASALAAHAASTGAAALTQRDSSRDQ